VSASTIDTIKRVYKAFETRDFGVIGEVFDPGVEIRQSELLPWGGQFKGHEGAVEFFTGLLGHIDPQLTVERLIDAGDRIVEVGRSVGSTVAGGVHFDVPELHLWQVRAGKVTSMEIYIDVPAMLKALG
jgi:ketosteroid isomerase-like protein